MAYQHAVPPPPPKPVPVTPTAERWARMSQDERERWLLEVLDALSDPVLAMSEGRPHKRAKSSAASKLGMHFKDLGRVIYVAEEMAVVYPGEKAFTPDIFAVVDVPEPEDDERLAWVVMDEGRGPDVAIEILHRGDRKKDLEDNVERYARLGILEYFVYDRLRQRVLGYRLPSVNATRYQPIVPQGGRYGSRVLGLDLSVVDGQLRLYYNEKELFGSDELVGLLRTMLAERTAKLDAAQAEAERAQAEAERAQAEAERARDEAIAGMRELVLAALAARGLPCPDHLRDRVLSCMDIPTLRRWLLRTMTATSAEQITTGDG